MAYRKRRLQVSVEAELAVMKGALECCDDLAAKDSAEHLDRKKESVSWLDPTRAIGRKSTGRHHAMHVWVKFEFLTPGVMNASPAARTRSATSRGGQSIYSSSGGRSFSPSESGGLAVALS